MPKPFPAESRRDVIAVASKGEASIAQIARDFEELWLTEVTEHRPDTSQLSG